MDEIGLQRRQVFQGLIALSAVGGLAACGGESETVEPRLAQGASTGFFTNSEMALISALAQTLIPQTETAGAPIGAMTRIVNTGALAWRHWNLNWSPQPESLSWRSPHRCAIRSSRPMTLACLRARSKMTSIAI